MADIFVDANIFLDVMRSRSGWQGSAEVLNKVKKGEITGYVSPLTLTTLFYELRKSLSRERAVQELKKALQGFQTADLGTEGLDVILSDDRIRDFEDLVQFYSAKKVCSVIVTRNTHDYRRVFQEIQVLTPEQFLRSM